jgi:hypothetical protein
MIEWPEEKEIDLEIFKISKKSICHNCQFLKSKCGNKYMMLTDTDSKIGKAFVKKCMGYNLDNERLKNGKY